MQPALFLDRDGVIIENRADYVRAWQDVSFLPGSLDALAKISQSPYKIVIVTNQSAIGRGLITLEQFQAVHQRILQTVEQADGRVDATYFCPHAPHENCTCRKPQPGLFFQAAAGLDIDLPRSIMIGDALSDLQAAQGAGINRTMLVLTGRGLEQYHLPHAEALMPFQVYASFAAAVDALCELPRG